MRREMLTEFLLVSLEERGHVEGLPLGWSDNIKMDIKENGCDSVYRNNVAQDWDRLRAVVKTAMNMRMICNKYSHCFSKYS
jgi:hypothetical protein